MKTKPTLTPGERLAQISAALTCLLQARDYLKRADAPQATAKVRRALKSAEGAYRHAIGRDSRANR